MRLPHWRTQAEPDPLPAARRATTELEERWRDVERRLDAFSTRLAGAADRMWEMAGEATRMTDEAGQQSEGTDGHDT